MNENDEDQRTVWCGNLSEKVTEEILYELFLQAAPLEKVKIPKDKNGRYTSYGFVTFKHVCSVAYAIDLLNGVLLYDKRLNIKPRMSNVRQNLNLYQGTPLMNMPPVLLANEVNKGIEALHDVNLLMSLGERLLPNIPSNNFANSSTPNSWRDSSYRNSRREKQRPYRRHGNYHHNDRFYSTR